VGVYGWFVTKKVVVSVRFRLTLHGPERTNFSTRKKIKNGNLNILKKIPEIARYAFKDSEIRKYIRKF
jgi:hypothetical protein